MRFIYSLAEQARTISTEKRNRRTSIIIWRASILAIKKQPSTKCKKGMIASNAYDTRSVTKSVSRHTYQFSIMLVLCLFRKLSSKCT